MDAAQQDAFGGAVAGLVDSCGPVPRMVLAPRALALAEVVFEQAAVRGWDGVRGFGHRPDQAWLFLWPGTDLQVKIEVGGWGPAVFIVKEKRGRHRFPDIARFTFCPADAVAVARVCDVVEELRARLLPTGS